MILDAKVALPRSALKDALGVTRVARITGLDRTGVEVACAIRPRGHILQVSNGKGWTFAEAAASAVSEAAELAAAEDPSHCEVQVATVTQLRERQVACSWAGEPPGEDAWTLSLCWVPATALGSRARVLVPARAVFCPPSGTYLGPVLSRWTSNGLAAHTSTGAALAHAVFEVIERDQVARALPHGWRARDVRTRRVAPGSRRLAELVERLARRSYTLALFDLRPTARSPIPTAGALLFDRDFGPIPMTAGYACAPTIAQALEKAALEAAQSRLTDIHGAREDISPGSVDDARALLKEVERATEAPARGASGGVSAQAAAERLGSPFFFVKLATRPLNVVRVIAPELLVSELY